MSSANLPACDQSEHVEPIRLVAWHIAEQFAKLPKDVFECSSKLDKPENGGQKCNRWWGDEKTEHKQTTYSAGTAAHVAENLKWWSLSQPEKKRARKLAKGGVAKVQEEFAFDEAYLGSGLPSPSEQIKDLGDVIKRFKVNREGIVAYLEGLAVIYTDKACADCLSKLARKAVENARENDEEWKSFKGEAREVVRQLPLDPAFYVAP